MEAKNNIIYTDGACKGNPGNGGWGVYIITKDKIEKELYGYETFTTNNKNGINSSYKRSRIF